MWSDWLNFFGNFFYAYTCLLYAGESSSESYVRIVLIVETLAAFVNGSSAICGFAAWWFEEPLESSDGTVLDTLKHVLSSPYAWGHFTNFLPALVYMGSAMAAATIHYAQLANEVQGAGAVKMPDTLRLMSKVYWYGDLIWLGNGLLWLFLWYRDQCEEEETEEEGVEKIAGEEGSYRAIGGGGIQEEEASRLRKRPPPRKKYVNYRREVVPYRLYTPFLRFSRLMCSSRESYLALRGSSLIDSTGGGLNEDDSSFSVPFQPPVLSSEERVYSGRLDSTGETIQGSGVGAGRPMFKIVAVSTNSQQG